MTDFIDSTSSQSQSSSRSHSSLSDDVRQAMIEEVFSGSRALDEETTTLVLSVIEDLDKGRVRVATPPRDGEREWTVHSWVKQSVLLYFRIAQNKLMDDGVCTYLDKIPPKRDLKQVRVVPPGVARYGSHLET